VPGAIHEVLTRKLGEAALARPNVVETALDARKAVFLPRESDRAPQQLAPTIIPRNTTEVRRLC
jgi:hypothetical protein